MSAGSAGTSACATGGLGTCGTAAPRAARSETTGDKIAGATKPPNYSFDPAYDWVELQKII